VQVQSPQDQYQPAKASETLNGLLPVVIEVEQKHLRLSGLQDPVTELLDFKAGLERQLELATLNHDVREI
jgi:hypothetical protein